MGMAWEFYNEPFVVDSAPELPSRCFTHGPWSGHRRFAYDLTRFAKPGRIVELGTAFGTSFFSFCQAVRDGRLSTRCYAVDTWGGDPHAGYFGEKVYQSVFAIASREFPAYTVLLRMTFDQSLDLFRDHSVDLLHIDGYHTYEAALHDYETWFPKLAPGGIVLFHDIAVHKEDFGVHRLWKQLRELFPHMEFSHSHGLGVLFPKGLSVPFQTMWHEREAIVSHYG